MILGYEKFRMVDEAGDNDFFVEVNWEDNKQTNECKILKITYPDGKMAKIKRDYLNAMLFAIGREEDQRKMIPQKRVDVRWYETVLSIKATKDIRKGENITFPIKLTIPSEERQIIGDLAAAGKLKSSGKLLLP